MPQIFDCEFQRGEDGPLEKVHTEFPDDAWATLVEFVGHAETLFKCRAMEEIHLSIRLNWDAQSGIRFSGELPHEDDIAMILHRMRPFVLQKESTYLPKLCNVLSRYITLPLFRDAMKGVLNEFMGKAFREEMKIALNGAALNTDDMVNKWLNGFEYHHAADAQQALEVFRAVLPEEWQRAIFISMMVDKARQVGNLLIVVRWLTHGRNGPLVLAE